MYAGNLVRLTVLAVATLLLAPADALAFDFMKTMNDGGPFMWAILVTFAFGIVIIVERTIALNLKLHVKPEPFFDEIRQNVLKGNIKGAIEVCERKPDAALSHVLKAALLKADQPERVIQDAVDEADLEVLPKLQARTPYLNMIANVSTLMGLLGTILGLIAAFAGLAHADPSQKQAVLASGIAIAMNTTAFGLIAAIPCMIAHALLMGRTNSVVQKVDEYAVKLINLLIGLQKKAA
ncbi:MAG: MotA/TolQ/ExbB proton channel family protein [Candidatus Dadabacteria bacterium]|nr:MAG: MotA/TolQ/ExbB proton channel family protein [Candidatus Dadabacteria bacterium]